MKKDVKKKFKYLNKNKSVGDTGMLGDTGLLAKNKKTGKIVNVDHLRYFPPWFNWLKSLPQSL